MFGMFDRTPKPHLLTEPISEVLLEMHTYGPTHDEYERHLAQLERLYKLKQGESKRERISPDTLVTVAGNLAGILIIVMYEKTNVMTSKAFGYGNKNV